MEWKIKHFNELTTNGLYEIIKQRINVFVVEQKCPYFECDDKDLDSYHIYATDNNEIVAYARIIPPGVSYKEASIGRVLVKKDYRGNGLGRSLMERAIKYIIDELREDRIRISAQEYLLNFYKSLGFKAVSGTYLEDGIPHIEMLYEKKIIK
ncbi:GNAT family N-acetyltransferase [Thermohalobacter berrensis]|uniref:GNAT family N-acetyltransferase n=1 Tax=Thermohalobacter berrensis TaxID=99594 RepID=A0A419TA89_9FIRM|nr:GNAT family N-acetyltransferase [Thermohalobacter berrensis]RKD34386.1 GNAT family N-acetyltransferase [Thermohalobacter berrensis]